MAQSQRTETAARRTEYTPEALRNDLEEKGESLTQEMSRTIEDALTPGRTLYMAMDLGKKKWHLAFTVGLGQKPRRVQIPGGSVAELVEAIAKAKKRFGLAEDAPVLSCYEAGREAFWPHRLLEALGVSSLVVDSSSIEVSRRKRRKKTDKLDVTKLLTMLVRYGLGETAMWSVVRVPSVEAEDVREIHRERQRLKKDRTREINRVRAALEKSGLAWEGPVGPELARQLDALRSWDGQPLPPRLRAKLGRVFERLALINQQIAAVEAEREALLVEQAESDLASKIRDLTRFKGIGINSAWLLVAEFFGWRRFANRREVGGAAGLCGTPYDSGEGGREQGISRAGNTWVRATMIELGWLWLRHQPDSTLSRWYNEKWGEGSRRLRKIGIVALARKLLIALWRFLEEGIIPEGAVLQEA